ncbi:MAG: DUF4328 domain-containing protein [Bacteroidota bacterium]
MNPHLQKELIDANENRITRIRNGFKVYWILIIFSFVLSSYISIDYWSNAETDDFAFFEKYEWIDNFQGFIGLGIIIVFIGLMRNGAFYIRDVYHALSLSTATKFTVQSAFWSWFIPIIWWFRPLQVIKEIDKHKRNSSSNYEESYNLNFWWFGFLFYYWMSYLFAFVFGVFVFINESDLFLMDISYLDLYNFAIKLEFGLDIIRIAIGYLAYIQFLRILRGFLSFQKILIDTELKDDIVYHLVD